MGDKGTCCSLDNRLHEVMVVGWPLGDLSGSISGHGYVAIISPHWENNLVPKVVRITQGVPILPCGILKIQFCPLHQAQLSQG